MASTKIKLGVLKKSSPTSVSKTISKETSPDSKCPICLDQFKNISCVDKCLHRFCFRCIHEWSKNKAECPLCKQPFSSIYHSIKAEDDFKQYDLRPSENGSFGSLAGQRFRYRTTLTGDRRAERRTSPPPDHGVMFEGLSGSVSHGNDRGFHRMVARLAARRQAQGEGRTLRTLHEQEMIRFRRTLYRRGLWVRGVRDGGRSREISVEFFRGNPACLHRLVPWLKRELTVLYGAHGSLVNIVQHIVMSQITRYNLQDPAVLQELRPFLLSRTEHFIHEFQSFAQSPFNMEAYDQNAVYECSAPSAEENSGSDSSVITVSEDETNLPGTGVQASSAMLSQTPWDDETPGPSYSTDLPRVFTVSVTSSDSDSEEEAGPSTAPTAPAGAEVDEEKHSSSSEEDCVIVGYVKPTAERTPELVQLSSDSEAEETESNQTSQLQHIHFSSPPDLPTSPSSNQSAVREKCTYRHTSLSRSRPSPSHDHHPPSARRSSKNPRHKKDVHDRRHHSERKWKDRSRSRDGSSHCHRKRSKDRRQTQDVSSYHHLHTRHSSERGTSSRYYTHVHYSSIDINPEKYTRARSRERSRARSRDRSRARSRDRSRARSQTNYHSRSRSRSWSRSLNRRHSRNSSPSATYRRSRHDKPSGKRKYKSLHLEPSTAGATDAPAQENGSREKREKKRRSTSVEIIYEDESGKHLRKKHHKKKKKHKKKRKRSKEKWEKKSPTVITINSESDFDETRNHTVMNLPTGSNVNDAESPSTTPNVAHSERDSGENTTAPPSPHEQQCN
ncbi:topoisomerase I binding, arginine/serine-rich a isoform X2 [Pygocentrus nattereri]|uniref:topoisomerase I binding, arginine/serine-rich a isoform X2 n=1 Tax=Pygocentrus nattereri TaxID=42514 RepID=UPI0008144CAC|nr:topoisomerase I binding, arginine/serine-rich a isoform X2 [Pygocentrus nattereri]